jgi:hypothetical protein
MSQDIGSATVPLCILFGERLTLSRGEQKTLKIFPFGGQHALGGEGGVQSVMLDGGVVVGHWSLFT